MTTKVRLETHSWPVQVDSEEGELGSSEIVPINCTRDFYIHAGKVLKFTELPEQKITPPIDTGFVKAD